MVDDLVDDFLWEPVHVSYSGGIPVGRPMDAGGALHQNIDAEDLAYYRTGTVRDGVTVGPNIKINTPI